MRSRSNNLSVSRDHEELLSFRLKQQRKLQNCVAHGPWHHLSAPYLPQTPPAHCIFWLHKILLFDRQKLGQPTKMVGVPLTMRRDESTLKKLITHKHIVNRKRIPAKISMSSIYKYFL
jgi:hypothetical protein